MLGRCERASDKSYERYGGRGVRVCAEWHDFLVFRAWAQQAGYADGLQIDRIDNDGDYCPENCRFVSQTENLRNRPEVYNVSAWGETKTISEWAEDPRCVVPRSTLAKRVIRGWDPARAISSPSLPRGVHHLRR